MIPHNKPTLGKEEEIAALRVLRTGQLSNGDEVKKFENEFCEFLELPEGHAVGVSSGSSALFLAMKILFNKKETITIPGYVCSALRNAIELMKCDIDFLDIKKNSPNIDEKVIRENSNPKIIPHMYGIPVNIPKLRNGTIIEDCSHAIGAKDNDKFVGTIGEIGIFSFYVTKLMTSGGQGGMFISKNHEFVDAARDYREFDMRKDSEKRFNFQMTDLQAAIGREQLKKLPSFLKRREEIFNLYKKNGLILLDTDDKTHHPVRYRAIIKTQNPSETIQSLKSAGISSIIPTEDWEILGPRDLFPNSLKLSRETVSIPVYPSLKNSEIDLILSTLMKK